MLRYDAVADAQSKASSLSDGLRRVKRVKHSRRVFYSRTTIHKLNNKFIALFCRSNPQVSLGGCFENCVNRVVYKIQENLLQLMRVGSCQGQIRGKIQDQLDVIHAQIVIPQRQGILQDLIQAYGYALWLVLTREA